MDRALKITLWNTEWAKPRGVRGKRVAAVLSAGEPDIICVTEGYPEIFPATGHTVTGSGDHGYVSTDGRRKVMLWGARAWSHIDDIGSPLMPTGRFVSGITETPFGPVRLIAVCIPWQHAHVSTGRRNRKPWEDHLSFLDGLDEYLSCIPDGCPAVLLGDFNQRYPRAGQNKRAFERLCEVVEPRFKVVTGGVLPVPDAISIDHVAVSSHLECAAVEPFSNIAEDGKALSDHFGLRVRLLPSCSLNGSRRVIQRIGDPVS